MKDLTLYSRYSTFAEQLMIADIATHIRAIDNEEFTSVYQQLFNELTTKEFNSTVLELDVCDFDGHDKGSATIYTPIIDQYKKQYTIYVLYFDEHGTLVNKDIFRDVTSPSQMTKDNVKFIVSTILRKK